MGQSLGTGVVIDYVSKNIFWENPVILISAYKSVSRVLYDNYLTTYIYGKFDNMSKIDNVRCPIKFFHGMLDTLIYPSHTADLYTRMRDKTYNPTYLGGVKHSDILYALDIKEINAIVNILK
jgi:fermentation-respiration switch protein FrsA (DUF1100 family)